MRRHVLRSLILVLAVLGACSKPLCPVGPPASEDLYGKHVLLASIRRTSCSGDGPSYKLTVFRDGSVEYEGMAYVATKGKASGHLTRDQVASSNKR
jgi:hypothetical protein